MKKLSKVSVSLAILTAIGLVGCQSNSNDSISVVANDKVKGVSLSEELLQLNAGETKQLTALVAPETASNKNVVWSSSDDSVAVVDQNGLVTAFNEGDCEIVVKTEEGNFQAICEVSVSGYHRSSKIFKNINSIANNSGYNQKDGNENFGVDVSNEDYVTITFNRSKTIEWGSLTCYFDPKFEPTTFNFEVELMSGNLPACQFEFAGPDDFKFYKRVPLTIGERSFVSMNLTDLDLSGGWSNIFIEPNNPGDSHDEHRNDGADNMVELRLYKMELLDGNPAVPGKINDFRFDPTIEKLVFDKEVAASSYEMEVYKVVEGEDVQLQLDTKSTRFVAREVIPDMEVTFTPKKDENFAKEPGEYKARIRGVNRAGNGEWCDFISFTIKGNDGPVLETGYTSSGIDNEGAIVPNQYNADQESYKATLQEDGYHLSFTGKDNDWTNWKFYQYDSFTVSFNPQAGFTKFHMELEIVSGNVPLIQVEFCDWAEDGSSPEATDGYQLEEVQVTANTMIIDFDITTDLTKGLGQIALKFGSAQSGAGEVEIVVHAIQLTSGADTPAKGYTSSGIDNEGAIVPNQYNADQESYKATLQEDGYHLSFTGKDNDWTNWKLYQYDSFAVSFNPQAGFTKFHMELEIIDGNVPLIQVEFCDWAEDGSSPEATDGYQIVDVNVTSDKVVIDFDITTDLTKGLGQIALKYASAGSGAGDVEILVTNITLQ